MSQPEPWARIADMLAQLLDRPASERTAHLRELCGREPALRTELLAYFQELQDADAFLEMPAPGPDISGGAETGLGAYRVLRPIGEGGMGVVYLAERHDGQFSRQVAIKRIASGLPGPDLLRRFRDEREILAGLDHPNIARLLDAGVDAGGVPYLVMDYVKGVPITRHCVDRQLPVRDRLSLFLDVCAAVQYAHQNLVVHRDIKPANILVTAPGEPKLLDFGIAKVLGRGTGDITSTAARALSLDYASPEQVQGYPVTTASDVYSLGVLLYELLADVRPYDTAGKSLTEAIGLVCEATPPPLSTTAPTDRRAELVGDLDCIVARAMEKAPVDRYCSVAELSADVRAHLEHRPIEARPRTVEYVVRRFVRRHRAGVAVAVTMLLLMIAGLGGILWQARIADRERARAEARFGEVRELANFVIFELQDAVAKLVGSTTLRMTMVERSIAYLDSLAADAAGDPGLQLELAGAYVRLGDVLGLPSEANLGDREGALASYAKAKALYEQALSDSGDADVRRRLARLLLNTRTAHTDIALASEALQESMRIWEDLVREDPASDENLRGLASAHFGTYGLLGAEGEERAVAHMERALEVFQQLLARAPDDLDRMRNVALCHKYLGAYFASRDRARSLRHTHEAARLDAARVAADPEDRRAQVDYSISLGMLGDQSFYSDQFEQALAHYESVLSLRRQIWEADPNDIHLTGRLAYTLARIGQTRVLMRQPASAVPILREALQRVEDVPEPRRDGSYASTLLLAYTQLAEAAVAAREDACAWDLRAAELLRIVPTAREELNAETITKASLDRSLARAASCRGPRR